jgi:NADH-quinone oxidoreductase subunit L
VTAVYVALLAPALAAVVGILIGRLRPRLVIPVAVAGTSVSLVATLVMAGRALTTDALLEHGSLDTVPLGGGLTFGIDLRLDGLAAVVSVAVTVVALAVQVYSTAYLKGDPRYSSYAAFVSLFTAAMLLVVFADDLFVLVVGWEVMGVCSYFLIGHHWEQEGSRAGAVKALVTTRLGDVGFLFGIFALGHAFGTFNIGSIVSNAAALNGRLPSDVLLNVSDRTVTVATLLLLCGVVGKSAQFPLHTWLPDAMAGPTPISALIHAATMVAAGIYLVVRLFDVFLLSPTTLAVMAVIACISMLGAALAALAQDDIKRVLAYSTISQLAYMLAALAVGSDGAATFHLLTHAAFKALLFLAAGSVIHAVGTNLMPDMGGLRRLMPVTFVTMTVGLAALAGIPPFAGFFSKEAVLGAAEETAMHGGEPAHAWAGWLVLVVGLATVAVTAAYVTRLWLMTFFGESRSSAVGHDPSAAMRWPLVVLAVPSALLGLVALLGRRFGSWTGHYAALTDVNRPGLTITFDPPDLSPHLVTSLLSLALVALGAGTVLLAWRREPGVDPSLALGRRRPALVHAFYVDDLYDRAIVQPVRLATRSVRRTDDEVVLGAVLGTGRGARWLSGAIARTQGGNITTYLTGLLAGVLLIVAGVVVLT